MPIYEKILKNIHQPENAPLLDTVLTIISPYSQEIARNFYREMLSNPQAAHFLSHEEVKSRLTASMTNWINSIFLYRNTEQAIEEYRDYQFKIGRIHGKIGLPVSFVNYGMYLIKQDVLRLLIN